MEDSYLIKGGNKIQGSVRLSGAKNVALKAIIAALLFDSKVILENVPKINDVQELIHLINRLGAKAEFKDKNTLEIDSSGLKSNKVDLLHASKIRVSFMFFAPLLQKFGKCLIPNPGGCRIGARPIDRIIDGMNKLGAKIIYNHETGYYEASLKSKPEGRYKFNKSTHTGTELLILFSVFSASEVVLENVALEPEIDELINFLNEAGANIKRNKSRIIIKGVSSLKQKKPFRIISDSNEAVTFAILALASKGEVIVERAPLNLMEIFINKIEKTGSNVKQSQDKLIFRYNSKIKPVDIETAAFPGFKTDWQPNWAVLMTQAEGEESIIHERVFENRFNYVDELMKLGAHIVFIKPRVKNPKAFYDFNYKEDEIYQQAIRIQGGFPLHGGVLNISDLRAGASLAIASLIAEGESIISGASILERGYEDFVEKVKSLGGDIKKI